LRADHRIADSGVMEDGSPIGYRIAGPADAPVLGALHVASWRASYAGMLPDAMLAELSVEARAAMWGVILGNASAGATVHVAEEGGQTIGFGCCNPQRDATLATQGFGGEIGAIYVLAASQGKGVGRMLMHRMARTLLDQGLGAAALWVLRDNRVARLFYERLGGVVVGERTEQEYEAVLVEHAYGWRDLRALAA
jgi:GNAT superfamily N-acetyltransferase